MTDREPVAQAINSIIGALEVVARMLNDPATCDEVTAEEVALWTVKNHAEWICSSIRLRQEASPDAVKEKRDDPKIRVVK